jgi:hypothetical protein
MSAAVAGTFRMALEVSGKGMLALFAFMLLFYILLVAVDKIFPAREEK